MFPKSIVEKRKISNLLSSNGCIFLNSFMEVAAVSNSPNVVLECTFKCEINGLVDLQKKKLKLKNSTFCT